MKFGFSTNDQNGILKELQEFDKRRGSLGWFNPDLQEANVWALHSNQKVSGSIPGPCSLHVEM